MNDTPRTDAIAHRGFHVDVLVAKAIDLCRELERENAALREQLINVTSEVSVTKANALADKERLERENAALKQRILDDNKAYGFELRDPSGTIWDHAKKLQTENDALRSALDQQANYQRELRADRDRLDAICHGWRISHEVGSVGFPDHWFIWTRDWSQPIGEGKTLREAIDAARK